MPFSQPMQRRSKPSFERHPPSADLLADVTIRNKKGGPGAAFRCLYFFGTRGTALPFLGGLFVSVSGSATAALTFLTVAAAFLGRALVFSSPSSSWSVSGCTTSAS